MNFSAYGRVVIENRPMVVFFMPYMLSHALSVDPIRAIGRPLEKPSMNIKYIDLLLLKNGMYVR